MVFDGPPHTGDARWTGEEFIADRLKEFSLAFPRGPVDAFSDVEGWSKRSFLSPEDGSRPVVTEFALGGHAERLITSTQGYLVTIDLDRQNGTAAQRLVSIDTRPRGVSADEYAALFRK